MSADLKAILKNKFINQWYLFWLITLPISAAVIIVMAGKQLTSGESVSSMIQFSVRCSIPWLYLAFAASSIHVLFPTEFSRWLLRNRKIMGLCFAAAMAWQLIFILWMLGIYTDYYAQDVYVLRDLIEGIIGYLFLIAMTISSFKSARRKIGPKSWRNLHRTGIYFLWAYAWSVYWYNLFYYTTPGWVDYTYYWTGFLAWFLRMAAWTKNEKKKSANNSALAMAGGACVAIGLIAITFGSLWSAKATKLLNDNEMLSWLELYFPYYPFTPFLPMFIIMLGAALIVRPRAKTTAN
jgi:DMSO/TMAO reductase YedYZ heme-binding membrane subunit